MMKAYKISTTTKKVSEMIGEIVVPITLIVGAVGLLVVLRERIKRGVASLLRLMLGLVIVGVVGWYVLRLLLTAQVVILVQPGDPLFNMLCGGVVLLLIVGFILIGSSKRYSSHE